MAEGVVEYPFPLRPDCQVFLRLPQRLTRQEIARLVAFLEVLVLPESTDAVREDPR